MNVRGWMESMMAGLALALSGVPGSGAGQAWAGASAVDAKVDWVGPPSPQAKVTLRERWQAFDNFDFDRTRNDARSELDSRLGMQISGGWGAWRWMLRPAAAWILDRRSGSGSNRLSWADMVEGWVEHPIFAGHKGAGRLSLRLGRQQLAYGDQRLIGRLGWKDVPRTFDGARLIWRKHEWQADALFVHPADLAAMTPAPGRPRGSALVTWEDRTILGLYTQWRPRKKMIGLTPEWDGYWLQWRHSARATIGQGRNMATVGMRWALSGDRWRVAGEGVVQRGHWASGILQRASAWAVSARWRVSEAASSLGVDLGVEYDLSPGDDKRDPRIHRDFVFPFHTNHMHYGEMDRFSWANMRDLRLSARVHGAGGWMLALDWHRFLLDKPQGDWLNVAGTGVLFAGNPSWTRREAGQEVDLKMRWRFRMRSGWGVSLIGMTGWFLPGATVAERNGGRADRAQFVYLMGEIKI